MEQASKSPSDVAIHESPCANCMAACCRYVATQIDTPTSKRDYDHIRWYLHHRGVYVFIDHDGGWFLEFDAECDQLLPDHRCGIYGERPRICQLHGEDDVVCEFVADEAPHSIRFTNAIDFERYLDARAISWRWKRSPAPRAKGSKGKKRKLK